MRWTAEAKVGLVVLLGALTLTYMTFTVGGYRFGPETGYRLYALFNTVAGVDTKSPVRVAGVEVGKVETITLQDGQAKVTLRIRPEIKLRQGTQAAVRATGLLGEKYIELVPGGGQGLLQEGDTVIQSEQAADVDRLISQFSEIAADIKNVTAYIREAFQTKEGEASLKELTTEMAVEIRDLSRNLNLAFKDNRGNFTEAVTNIQESSQSLKEVGQFFKEIGQSLKEELPKLLESLDRTSEKLEMVVARVEKGEGTLGKLIAEEGVYDKLNSALAGLDSITKRVEKGEGTIGKLFTDEKAYNQMTAALEGLSNVVSRVERFKTIIGFRNEYQLRDNKGYFSLQLQPRPDKFYLLELVDDPRGEVKETLTQKDSDPPVPGFKRRLKFSALFGKRFSDLTLRVGLMENTFGVGTDYFLLADRLRFSLDAWDFNDPEGSKVHLKTTASYHFLNYFFIHGGYDDFFNEGYDNFLKPKFGTGFIGGGIRFEDDDLKYLLGSGLIRAR